MHIAMAWRMRDPDWELTDPECARYSVALQKALRHIPIKVSQLAIDLSGLAACIGEIEGKRIRSSARKAMAARAGAQPRGPFGPAQVFPFPTPAAAPAGPIRQPVSQGQGDAASPPRPAPAAPLPPEMPPEGFVFDGIDAPIGGLL